MKPLLTNYQLSSATYGLSLWERKLKNKVIFDVFFMCYFFQTNDVFVLKGFQSNQITMALVVI